MLFLMKIRRPVKKFTTVNCSRQSGVPWEKVQDEIPDQHVDLDRLSAANRISRLTLASPLVTLAPHQGPRMAVRRQQLRQKQPVHRSMSMALGGARSHHA